MLDHLREIDPELLELPSGDGRILISNALQGRIFAAFGGSIVHRFDREAAANSSQDVFSNVGGNSLWPAPEGGSFAFFYPPEGQWRVQEDINRKRTGTFEADACHAVIGKELELVNRKSRRVRLGHRRTVRPVAAEQLPRGIAGLHSMGYTTLDELLPREDYHIGDVLFCCWSLEQFPGAEGVMAFGRCETPAETCINDDYYGSASSRLSYSGNSFKFQLGGEQRLQIGVRAASRPALIGSLDRGRGVMAIRETPCIEGAKYINIADNDQASGPFGASDMFSIFNGSRELGFHELETIAPLPADVRGTLSASALLSTTYLFSGPAKALEECLESFFHVQL